MTKEQITQLARPLLVKVLTRLVLYALTAWLGLTAVEATDTATQVGTGLGAILALLLGVLVDRWHQKKDRAELPPAF